jgi:hypothetical protein
MAQISEWGPHLWKVLHTLAEKGGTSVLVEDEVRTWINVLRLTEGVLPCAMCRAHYKAWRRSHPLEEFLGQRGEYFQNSLRSWLWELHNSVNIQREVAPDYSLSFEGLEKYKTISPKEINDSINTLIKIFEKALLHRQVNPTYVTEWRRAIAMLRKLLSF